MLLATATGGTVTTSISLSLEQLLQFVKLGIQNQQYAAAIALLDDLLAQLPKEKQ